MKTFIATTTIALSLSAPAFADVTDAAAFFALSNDSAAERHVGTTSTGDPVGTAKILAQSNTSPAETTVVIDRARTLDDLAIRKKFALTNESPAENIIK